MKMTETLKIIHWHFTSLSSYLLAPLVLSKMDFQKDSLYLIFSIQFLAWLVYMDSLLIKQVFIELYFTLGSLLAFS